MRSKIADYACVAFLSISCAGAGFLVGKINSDKESAKELDTLRLASLRTISDLEIKLKRQESEIELVKSEVEAANTFYSQKLGDLQHDVMMGQIKVEKILDHPVIGGELDGYHEIDPHSKNLIFTHDFGFNDQIESLSNENNRLLSKLELIQSYLDTVKLESNFYISGMPILRGWLSSNYGFRSDPFTGKEKWHNGVDLAGKSGDPIVATAAGVVTYSGKMWGYGNIVVIEHDGGYKTRYAHCSELLVNVGDVIQKGQKIALMGSTGRSTGPHVHYEVVQGFKQVNPASYIYRDGLK